MDVFVFQLVRRLDIIGVGDDTLDGTNHDASGLGIVLDAFTASIGIYAINMITLKNRLIRALLATRASTSAFFRTQ